MIIARIMLILLAVIFSSSCSRKIHSGIYKGNCILYHWPEAYFQLKNDSSFVYVWPYIVGEQMEGTWKVDGSVLKLIPEYLVANTYRERIKPEHTFAKLPDYKIKGDRLIEIANNKYRKKPCYFTLVKLRDTVLSGL